MLTLGFAQNKQFRLDWENYLPDLTGIEMKRFKSEFFDAPVFKDILRGKFDLKEHLSTYLASYSYQGTVQPILDFWFSKGTLVNTALFDKVKNLHKTGYPLDLLQK